MSEGERPARSHDRRIITGRWQGICSAIVIYDGGVDELNICARKARNDRADCIALR